MAAPKGLFPPEPEHYRGPKLKVAIIGAGLAGMSTAVELLDQGHEVWPILFYPSQMLTICLLCFLQISNGLIIPPFHHFFFFWKWRIRYKISILGYSAKFFQQKSTREYFIFCYFNAFSLWGYSLPLFYFLFLYFQVDIYESRSFIGGKVGSFVDRRGNHIEMGLHVFFGCYNNLFRLMKKVNITCLVAVIWHSSIRCKLYTLVLYS